MMLGIMIRNVAIGIGIGSFIFLMNGVFGSLAEVSRAEIISVWIASGLIGLASIFYHTEMATLMAMVIQFGTGIIAFNTVAVINEWITLSVRDMLIYGFEILVLMLIIYFVFYFVAVIDSRRINEKLKEE